MKPIKVERPAAWVAAFLIETIHWHANGESYWLVGEAMGRDMAKLLGQEK